MADEGEGETHEMKTQPVSEEVFLNGDSDTSRDNNLLHPEDNSTLPEQVLPRRSSLVKDPNRRNQRKTKTVSFSSMPNEKTVVNGKFIWTADQETLSPATSRYLHVIWEPYMICQV